MENSIIEEPDDYNVYAQTITVKDDQDEVKILRDDEIMIRDFDSDDSEKETDEEEVDEEQEEVSSEDESNKEDDEYDDEDDDELESKNYKKSEIDNNRRKLIRRVHEYKKKTMDYEDNLRRLQEENDNLKRTQFETAEIALKNAEEKISAKLASLKDQKLAAKRDDDIDKEMDIDLEITKLMAEKIEIDRIQQQRLQYKEEYKRPIEEQNVKKQKNTQQEIEYTEDQEEWLEANPWFDQRSKNFDQEAFNSISIYSNYLADKWNRNGMGDEVGSKEFLEKVTKYAKKEFSDYYGSNEKNLPLKKKQSFNPNQKISSKSKPKFSEIDRLGMKLMGMTEKEWLKYR